MTCTRRNFLFTSLIPVVATLLLPSWAFAGTWPAYGPKTYRRSVGPAIKVTDKFRVLNPTTQYTLKAYSAGQPGLLNQGVCGCEVLLNGVQVIGPATFSRTVTQVEVPIKLLPANTITVVVAGNLGTVLSLEIIGVDDDPPVIMANLSPAPNAAGWNNSPVTVTFSCSDKTSGVASCSAPVTVSADGANQVVSGIAVDRVGNMAATSVKVNIDRTPPTITGTINPPPDATGWNTSAVTVTFTCADALSGIASCPSPVNLSAQGAGQVVTGTATDVAGNTAAATVGVNISSNDFKIRSWQVGPAGNPSSPNGKCLDYGTSPSGNGAAVFLNDCDKASPIHVIELGTRTGSGGTPLSHEVMLFAGKSVIGIHKPLVLLPGVSGAAQATTEFSLELQAPFTSPFGRLSNPANQIFRLDGDSIILEGSYVDPATKATVPGPCINTVLSTTLCPDPPPQLVLQVESARGANGSPIVAAVRNLSDNEFWDFVPQANSRSYPTSGFVPVESSNELYYAVANAGWGSVILASSPSDCKVADPLESGWSPQDIGGCIDLTGYPPLILPAGATIRGGRRGTSFGAQIYASYNAQQESMACDATCVVEVVGDYARVTGMRMRGQTRSTSAVPSQLRQNDGVVINYAGVFPNPATTAALSAVTELIATIDHNDMSDWADGAIAARSPFVDSSGNNNQCQYPNFFDSAGGQWYTCDRYSQLVHYQGSNPNTSAGVGVFGDPGTLANIRVARNFLHHNERDNGGYGVDMGNTGARFTVEGNTFDWNRHSITAAGEPHSQYRAAHNLVLSNAYGHYGTLGVDGRLQDFDMHGTDSAGNGVYFGGAGGYYVEIDGNTFLGTTGLDYRLRGYPGLNSYYHNNVSLRTHGAGFLSTDAVQFTTCTLCFNSDFPINLDSTNRFSNSSPAYTNPTARLGVGDFDGDGVDDLFLATGASWYYSPGGQRDWRFLNAAAEPIDQLLFGDFDGDGRTDVVATRAGQLVVSWGGISAFDVLNANPLPCTSISDMAVGDFDGDGKADIFCADGETWWISYGGNTPFVQVIVADHTLVKYLRFGDFDGDGTTDVFGVVNGAYSTPRWQIRRSFKGYQGFLGGWQPMPVSLTSHPASVDGLVVADFNGDGAADIGMSCFSLSRPGCWQISLGGAQGWQQYTIGSWATDLSAVGYFLGHADANGGRLPADLLFWNTAPFSSVGAMCDSSTGVNTELCLSVGGANPAYRYTSQDMR
jgi:hypothetical protein